MKSTKHLTPNEILAYADDLLPHQELFEIGRHLIECAECRRRLPAPTVEQFRSAIMTEWEPNAGSAAVTTQIPVSAGSTQFWKLPSVWAFGGAALIVLGIFTLLLLPGTKNSSDDIVRSIDHEAKTELNLQPHANISNNDSPFSSANLSKRSPNAADNKESRMNLKASKSLPKTSLTREPERKVIQNRGQFSSSRGAAADCSEEKSIDLEYSVEKQDLVFKWKKVPNAAKYHLYISDDDEILIDEFESSGETTFVLRKPLDPGKTYKWKIIITLEDGETVVGPSSKFTVKNFEMRQRRIERRKNSETRCSEDG